MDGNVLEVKSLQKNFGKFKALKNVTFNVKKGEVFGFIGPNGAGKSTTIRALLGILKCNGGSATIFGQDVWKDAIKIHERIAYVPGDVYLWPNLTGGQIIDLFLKLNGEKQSDKTDALIKEFALDVNKKARTYSKGNRQKVALIAAFSTDADFYIFDEPTSGLDPLNERIFQNHVKQLKTAGKSILLSSHILSEVEKMCDRIGIIRDGEVIETGTLDDLRHLTRTIVTVQTKQDSQKIAHFPGIDEFAVLENNKVSFAVDADQLSSVMAEVAALEIISIQSAPPTLEDLFMHYYHE